MASVMGIWGGLVGPETENVDFSLVLESSMRPKTPQEPTRRPPDPPKTPQSDPILSGKENRPHKYMSKCANHGAYN